MNDEQYAADRERVERIRKAIMHAHRMRVPTSGATLYASPDVIAAIKRTMVPQGYRPPFDNPVTAALGMPVIEVRDQGEDYIEIRWSIRG